MVKITDYEDSIYWNPKDAETFEETLVKAGVKDFNNQLEVYLNFGSEDRDDVVVQKDLKFSGLAKLKEDGKVGRFWGLGKLNHALNDLGVELDITGEIVTFKPDISGKKVTFQRINPREVTNEKGTKTYYDYIPIKIEGLSGATGTASGTPTGSVKPPAIPDDFSDEWYDWLVTNLDKPTSEAGIVRLMNAKIPDANARAPYTKSRTASLSKLVSKKLLTYDGELYSVPKA